MVQPRIESAHRLLSRQGKHWLYPWPVIGSEKYLIETDKLGAARLLQWAIQGRHLVANPNLFVFLRHHEDQATPIFRVDLKHFRIRLLNPPPEEVEHAVAIEALLSQALFCGETDRAYRLFQNQRNCKSCEPTGILEPRVEALMNEAIGCWHP